MAPRAFDDTVLPHLDAAFNYARWLTGNAADAEDVVQDACVKAIRFLSSFRDGDARAWLFTIVRNTWYSRVSRRASMMEATPLDSARDERPDEALVLFQAEDGIRDLTVTGVQTCALPI